MGGWMGIQNSKFRISSSSDWIRNIDEFDVQSVVVAEPAPESADAEPLGRVVTGSHEMDAVLRCCVHDPLRDLAGHEGIEACGDRIPETLLRSTKRLRRVRGHPQTHYTATPMSRPLCSSQSPVMSVQHLPERIVLYHCAHSGQAHATPYPSRVLRTPASHGH